MEKVLKDPAEIEAANYKRAIDLEYRTDHLTLPNPPTFQDPEEDAKSDEARKGLLNPQAPMDAVVDTDGTTREEARKKYVLGMMPEGAPKDATSGVGKHKVKIETVEGVKTLSVIAPETNTAEAIQGDTGFIEGKRIEVVVPSTKVTEDEKKAEQEKKIEDKPL